MRYFFTLNLCLFTLLSMAQVSSSINSSDYRAIQEQQYVSLENGRDIQLSKIDGSPYLTKDYVPGKVIDTKKDIEIKANIRYNAYKDDFIFSMEGMEEDSYTLPRQERYQYEYEGERYFILVNDRLFEDTNNKYVIALVHKKDLKLYKRYSKRFKRGREFKSSYKTDIPPKFIPETHFYLKAGDNAFKEIELKRRKVADAFPPKYRKKVKSYIYDKRLKFKDESAQNSLLRLLRYYLTLE